MGITVKTREQAWAEANRLFPTDYEQDEASTKRAGYPIYESTSSLNRSWISDLGNRLELNIWGDNGVETTNIWIEEDEEEKKPTSGRANHWYSDEFCSDSHARNQEQLQNIAKRIRENCKVTECSPVMCQNDDGYVCTIYENKNLGLKYWIKDEFGHITEIDEMRWYTI